jgi:glycosyltransferase involved in cell wall biosynthesis
MKSHSQATKPSLLSVVVPCFNEEAVIQKMHDRLSLALGKTGLSYEIIYVDDGSRDNTPTLLRELQAADDHVRLVSFARNFGHQLAVTAGVDFTTGDAVVLIDADLQDPPELIQDMVRMWRNGAKVVYGVRESRMHESAFKLLTAKYFYRLINLISDVEIPFDTGDFRLMDRCVVEVLKKMPERDRFVRGMVSWIGFKQIPLHYARLERAAGSTKYSLLKMIRFAFDAILSFSLLPLRMAAGLGLASGITSAAGFIFIIFGAILRHQTVSVLSLFILFATFLASLILSCLGIVGEYVGRIYCELKRRPLYVVSETHGFAARNTAAAA